ncbi:MAG: exodeoxyribonuclease VII small subunit [Clostridia bacterium]|nr:exodeoxyribonuclease VII small subunit [Clostridia bacterium]
MSENNEKTFEESLNELEKVAQNLERGELSLEDAITEFEKGIKLSKECSEKLENAEKRINILVKNENGELEETNFEQE